MRALTLLCSILLTISLALGQAAPRAFEVASIRPVELRNIIAEYSVAGTAVRYEVYNIPMLIMEAYGMEYDQVVISPQVFRPVEGFYTVAAKAPGAVTPTQAEAREMLKELLASRLHLKFHRELRQTPVYSMLPGKGGVKLRETKSDEPAQFRTVSLRRNETMEYKNVTAEDIARGIRRYVDRPVVDRTGLAGKYDVTLEATPIRGNPQPDDISVFSAIQESLGLRLESERVPMPVIVVDAVDRPTEN